MDIKDIEFKTSDLKKMCEIMKHYNEFPMPLAGKNEDNENILISINEHNITVQTFQNNGWLRTNIYHDDGTIEELYDK